MSREEDRDPSALPRESHRIHRSRRHRPRSWRSWFGQDSGEDRRVDVEERDRWIFPRRLSLRARRRLNVPVLLAGVAGAAFLVIGGIYWHQYQISRQPTMLLDAAAAAEKDKNFAVAESHLEVYLSYRPNDLDVLARLADLQERWRGLAGLARAAAVYSEILRLDPANEAARGKFAEIQLRLNPKAALEESRLMLGRDPRNLRGLRLRAQALDRLSMDAREPAPPADVARAMQEVLAVEPGDIDAANRFAEILRSNLEVFQKEFQTDAEGVSTLANRAIDRMVAANATSAKAHLVRYVYRKRHGGAAPAPENGALDPDLKRAVELEPKNPEVLLAVVDFHAPVYADAILAAEGLAKTPSDENLAEAIASLEEIKDPPRHLRTFHVLAKSMIAWYSGDVDGAVDALRKGVGERLPHGDVLSIRAAEMLVAKGRFEDAKGALDRLFALIADYRRQMGDRSGEFQVVEAAGRVLAANIALHPDNPRRDPARATEELKEALKHTGSRQMASAIFAELARCHALLGQWDLAVRAYQTAAGQSPESRVYRLGLAKALRSAGRVEEAAAEYRVLLEKQPRVGGDPLAAELWTGLAQALLEIQLRQPQEKRRWEEFQVALDQLRRLEPRSPTPFFLELARASRPGDPTDNKRLLDKLAKGAEMYGGSAEFWRRAAETYSRLGRADLAENAIERGESASKSKWFDVRAALQLAQGRTDEASRTLAQTPRDGADWLPRQEAILSLAVGDVPQARRSLERVLADNPRDLGALAQLAELAAREGNWNQVHQYEERLRAADPDGGLADYLQVVRLLQSNRPEEANAVEAGRAAAQALVRRRPNWNLAQIAAGMAAERVADWDGAIAAYEKAFLLGDLRPMLVRKLLALKLEHRPADAAALLGRLPDELLVSPSMLPLAVTAHLGRKEPDRAEKLARAAVARRPNDPLAHRLLGAALWAASPERAAAEAGELFKKSVELGPADPRGWVSALHFHANAQGPDQSLQALAALRSTEQLFAALPGHGFGRAQLANVAASCLLLEGDVAGSIAVLEKGLSGSNPAAQAGEVADFEVLVKELPPPAARTLSLVAAADPGIPAPAEASLLRLDPLFRGLVWLARGGRDARQKALAEWKKIPHARLRWGELVLLARIARLDGDAEAAKRHYQEAVARGASPAQVGEAVDYLLQQGNAPAARHALARLDRKSAPAELAALLDVKVLWAEGKRQAALEILRAETERSVTNNEPTAEFVRKAAERLEGIDNRAPHDQVTRVLRDRAAKNPADAIYLADWLSRQPGGFSEAISLGLEIAERARGLDGTIWHLGSIAQRGMPSEEENRRIEAVLGMVRNAEGPGSIDALAAVSWRREHQRRFDEAVRAIEAALAHQPDDPFLLNNLAWLMIAYQNRPLDAAARIDRAILRAGPAEAFVDTRACLLINNRGFDEAVALLEGSILASSAPSGLSYLHLADAHRWAGRRAECLRMLQAAKTAGLDALSPRDADVLRELEAFTQDR